jgi:hypothetical protein
MPRDEGESVANHVGAEYDDNGMIGGLHNSCKGGE